MARAVVEQRTVAANGQDKAVGGVLGVLLGQDEPAAHGVDHEMTGLRGLMTHSLHDRHGQLGQIVHRRETVRDSEQLERQGVDVIAVAVMQIPGVVKHG